MARVLKVKFKYQDDVETIPATRAEEKLQRLAVFYDAEQVASLDLGNVDHWWLTDDKAKPPDEKF